MKKTFFSFKHLVTLALGLTMSVGAFAYADAKVQMSVSATSINYGETVNVSVTVDKAAKYSVEIPTDKFSGETFDFTGGDGTKENQQKTYTAIACGTATFKLNVTTGELQGDASQSVTIHPLVPTNLKASNITPTTMDLSWDNNTSATTYKLLLKDENGTTKTIENIGTSTYSLSNLLSNEMYTIDVYSQSAGLESKSAATVSAKTLAMPELTVSPSTAEVMQTSLLGKKPTMVYSVSGTNLQDKITLTLSGEGASAFSLSSSVISKADKNGDVTLSFNPSSVGDYSATLEISTLYGETKKVVLQGSCVDFPSPTIAEPSDIRSSSFVANWIAVDGATDYVLTVYDNNGFVVEGYDAISVGNTTSYNVTNLLPLASYSYKVSAKQNDYVVSPMSEAKSLTTLDGAVITYVPFSSFDQLVGTSSTKTIFVEGAKTIDVIVANIEGDGFSIQSQNLTKEGGKVVVEFAPTEVKSYNGKLILSSTDAETKEILISGNARPKAVEALNATNVKTSSFVANWKEGVSSEYLLTVKKGNSIIINEQLISSVTSFEVTGLELGSTYTYFVRNVVNGLKSYVSNEIQVVMPSVPQYSALPNKTSISFAWESIPNALSYDVVVSADGADPIVKNTTENSIVVDGLASGVKYACVVKANYVNSVVVSGTTKNVSTIAFSDEQVGNSDFELWDNESNESAEPQNWNGFKTAGGSFAGTAAGQCMESTTDVRPGAVAGSKGVYLYSYKVFGVNANGNLTVGKINAGAMSAEDQANHNATIQNDEAFSETMTSRPDSITAWVKLMTNGVNARLSAIIHDDFAFEDPSREEDLKHAVGEAKLNYARVNDESGNATWQRLSVPFDYAKYASLGLNPKYILITFTTNATPGGSAAQVYVDDMALIYKPTLSIADLTKNQYVGGDVISLNYSIVGSMSVYNINAEANVVRLELSDANGSFANPTILASKVTNESGMLSGTLPANLAEGDNYRLRVVTTNYPMISTETSSFAVRKSPMSPVAEDPTNVSAVSFTANWGKVENATSYILTIKDSNSEIIFNGSVEENSYTVNGLSAETKYVYSVVAVNDFLRSESSNIIEVSTKGGGSFNVSGNKEFSKQNTVSKLTVEGIGLIEDIIITLQDESNKFKISTNTLPLEGGEFDVNFDASTVGRYSATISLKSKLAEPLILPLTGVVYPSETTTTEASEVGLYSFKANWSAVEGADSYDLIIKENGTQILNPKGLTSTSYVVENLKPNTTYTYSVVVNQNGVSSESSSEQTVTTLALPVIDNLVIGDLGTAFFGGEAISKTFTLSGSNLTEQISAVVSDTENFSVAVEDNQLTVSYKPVAVKDYSAMITLSHANATSVEIAISGKTALSAPVVGVATDITNQSATLSWNEVPGAMSYMVFVTRVDDNAPVGNPISAESTTCSLSVARANRNKKLSYYVQAIAGDVRSENSDSSQFQLFSAAKLSDATNITETGFTANFSASAVAGVAYKVVVLNESGVEVFNQTTTETSIDVTGLTTNAAYTYTVTTICEGNEQISAVSSIQLISASTILEATNITETGFTANFSASAVAGVEYKIVVLDENEVEVFSQTTTETSIDVTGLKPETTYTYTIATIVGGNEQVSALATITTDVALIEPDPSTSVENAEVENLVVYPNPTVDVINVKGVNVRQAVVYSNVGQQLMNVQSAQSIDVSTLPAGVYQLIIVSEEGTSRSVSFMKK